MTLDSVDNIIKEYQDTARKLKEEIVRDSTFATERMSAQAIDMLNDAGVSICEDVETLNCLDAGHIYSRESGCSTEHSVCARCELAS